jgi:hypothetical protein
MAARLASKRAGTAAPMPIRMIDTGITRPVLGDRNYFNVTVLVGASFAAMTFPAMVLLPKEIT